MEVSFFCCIFAVGNKTNNIMGSFKNAKANLRKQIEENLISLLDKHCVSKIDCKDLNLYLFGRPSIMYTDYYEGISYGFLLETVTLHNDNDRYIKFEGSTHTMHILHGHNISDSIRLDDMKINHLIEVMEWIELNEDVIFD